MLKLDQADVYYGEAQALYRVSVELDAGEAVALLGRNGAGKSTTMKALAGWMTCRRGSLSIDGRDFTGGGPEAVSMAGVALVPEDRQVFPTLTVEENLRIAQVAHPARPWGIADIWELFPQLKERRTAAGASLSGGEQQMLSIGRALMCQPRALLLDEPTEGLAPVVVATLTEAIRRIIDTGMSVVLVEQNARVPRRVASRFYVFDSGRVAWEGDKVALDRDAEEIGKLLSV